MQHRPALDGLRAVAIGAVLVEHAHYLIGGYQGVALFFVLSGYLITTLLWREQDSGGIAVRKFYARRSLRLFPALVATVVLALLIEAFRHTDGARVTGIASVFALTYTTNFAWGLGLNDSHLLQHTWTLAIEEQFYLLWPFALIALTRRRDRRVTIMVSAAVILIVGRMILGLAANNTYARTLPPTDSAALVAGAALAALAPHLRRPKAVFATAAVLAAGVLYLAVGHTQPYQDDHGSETWGLVATLVASLALVGLALTRNWFSSFLSWRPLVWIGQRSYGIYLYDFPVSEIFKQTLPNRSADAVLQVVVTIAVAALSYRFIEQPALRLKERFRAGRAGADRHDLDTVQPA